jgi:hypothetical protein
MLKLPNGPASFLDVFGDYYVAGYELGADAGACLSASSSASSSEENLEVKVQVKVLCFEHEAEVKAEHNKTQSASAAMRFVAYDSLSQSGCQPMDIPQGTRLKDHQQTISQQMSMIGSLLSRVRATIKALDLNLHGSITEHEARQLCTSGVVKKLILQPYTVCSDYVLASMESTPLKTRT